MILRFLRLFAAFREAELTRDEAAERADRWEAASDSSLESSGVHMRRGLELEAENSQLKLHAQSVERRAAEFDSQCKAIGAVLAETQLERIEATNEAKANGELLVGLREECAAFQRRLDTAVGAKIEAQDRVRDLESQVTELNGAVAEANGREALAVKCVADWMAMQMFGRPVYGVAPQLPEGKDQSSELIPRAGIQGRALAQQMEDEFFGRAQ